jgi:hypothetical protein
MASIYPVYGTGKFSTIMQAGSRSLGNRHIFNFPSTPAIQLANMSKLRKTHFKSTVYGSVVDPNY